VVLGDLNYIAVCVHLCVCSVTLIMTHFLITNTSFLWRPLMEVTHRCLDQLLFRSVTRCFTYLFCSTYLC